VLTRRTGGTPGTDPADDLRQAHDASPGSLSRRATLRLAVVGALGGAAVAVPATAHAAPPSRPGREAPQCLEDLWGR
jgi:hypothetical protein